MRFEKAHYVAHLFSARCSIYNRSFSPEGTLMYTLGINAVYHDSAACLVKDGQVIAAVEEERFTHVKHGKRPIPFSTNRKP